MPEAVMEARISITFDWGNVFLTVAEARELRDQLDDALPLEDDVVYNKGGSFGFAPATQNEEENDCE